jgi:hypothetical protein
MATCVTQGHGAAHLGRFYILGKVIVVEYLRVVDKLPVFRRPQYAEGKTNYGDEGQ